MQSNQSSVPSNNQQKLIGHRRRPSIGKSMPVTSLLLNFSSSSSSSELKKNEGRDGKSPEIEKPPIYFRINELNDETNPISDFKSDTESCDENVEEDYEILISDCSSDDNDEEAKLNDDKVFLIGKSKFYLPPCLTCTPPPPPSPNLIKSKSLSPSNSMENSAPFKELCEKLCNNDCKNSNNISDLEDFGKSFKKINKINKNVPVEKLLKVPNKLDLERKKFLDEMLKSVKDEMDSDSDNNKNDAEDESIVSVINEANIMLKDFREKFMIAEALNKTSMMTSPAAKRRLAARKIEMELDSIARKSDATENNDEYNNNNGESDFVKLNKEFIPPRELLLYLVRMGSFNSAPKINNIDAQDDNLVLPQGLTTGDLIRHCKNLRGENRPQLLTRYFLKPTQDNNDNNLPNNLAEELRVFHINSVSKDCSPPVTSPKHLRILQWNILSQSLGQSNDGFVCCPGEALTWENRKFLIVEEILQNNPDIICLQEVDHFKFLENILGSQGYCGIFFPKPDSPCLYIEENNGPDGCAIFYKRDKFELINTSTRILEVWRVQSNQVAIVANLRINETEKEFTVGTTHLKARHGALLSKLRNEQGKDLLRFVSSFAENRPILLCGDFNAEPIEPVYSTVLNDNTLGLSSAYADISEIVAAEQNCGNKSNLIINDKENYCEDKCHIITDNKINENNAEILAKREPPYTTWKIREDGEVCHTIDYVFYSKNHFKVNNCLLFPQGEEIGKNRTPSFQYPSDHFSLVCDFEILDNQKKSNSNCEK